MVSMGGLSLRVLKGSSALLLVVAGCGGRSSTLETDGTTGDGNQPSDGSGATNPGAGATGPGKDGSPAPGAGGQAGSPTAGPPSVGTGARGGIAAGSTGVGGTSPGGTAGVGTAGSPAGGAAVGGSAGIGTAGGSATGGAVGVAPSTYVSCANYCSTSTQGVCPNAISVDACTQSCLSEVGAQSPSCQKNAEGLLDCLTTAYQYSMSCSQFDELALTKCSALSATYQSCASAVLEPPPVASPGCSSSGSSSKNVCDLSVKCDSGAYYTVQCRQTNTGDSNCTCQAAVPGQPGVGAGFTLNESVTFACYDSLAACGFPQLGAK
jgi:hypothetical protein